MLDIGHDFEGWILPTLRDVCLLFFILSFISRDCVLLFFLITLLILQGKLGLPGIKMLTTRATNEPDLIVTSFIIFTKIQVINLHLHGIRAYNP